MASRWVKSPVGLQANLDFHLCVNQAGEQALDDAEFLAEVLESLPGVDTKDPRFESMLKKPDEKKDDKDKEGSA